MDMKHAIAVSYLNMSLGRKVRQELTDVLQPAWPLKHISMLMDVSPSLKNNQSLPLISELTPNRSFVNLFSTLKQREQAMTAY